MDNSSDDDRIPCEHYTSIAPTLSNDRHQELQKIIATTKQCKKCSVGTNLQCCLKCGFIGCGRHEQKHAIDHYEQDKSHCVVLSTTEGVCWCYECDNNVPVDMHMLIKTKRTSPKKIRRLESPLPEGILGGFNNLGNTCYINAAIQVLLNCPSIWGYFLECNAFINPHMQPMADAILDTILELQKASSTFSPGVLVKQIKSCNPMFQDWSQQDSMDLLRFVLDRLHEELKYSTMQIGKIENLENNSPSKVRRSERLAGKMSQDYLHPSQVLEQNRTFRSVIGDTFGGRLRSEIICHKCRQVSIKEDPFFDLSIPLKATVSTNSSFSNLMDSIGDSFGFRSTPLESYLQAFCATEVLDGKDRYRCERCNTLVSCNKRLYISSLPPILCLQLKRFRHDSYFGSKINTSIPFPLTGLDMRYYLHEQQSSNTIYDLSGVIHHKGSLSSGHYIAYCKKNGMWIEYDDSNARIVPESHVAKIQAYILLYSRRGDDRGVDALQDGQEVWVSRRWYNRHLHLGNQGPPDSSDVLCIHSKLRPGITEKHLVKIHLNSNTSYPKFAYIESLESCPECEEQIRELDRRRRKESSELAALDSTEISPGQHWYMISQNWLSQWLRFRAGGETVPGPIDNSDLLHPSSDTSFPKPRPGLHRGEHYRGVNEAVWSYLFKVYGGGPAIPKFSINIYSQSPDEEHS